MAYRLMVKKNNDKKNLIPIQIERSPVFRELEFQTDKYGFKEIDLFTARFVDMSELMKHLVDNRILAYENSDMNLVIVWDGDNENFKKKHHPLLFMNSAEYLAEPVERLEEFMFKRVLEDDYEFYEKLFKDIDKLFLDSGGKSAVKKLKEAVKAADTYGDTFRLRLVLENENTPPANRQFLEALIFMPTKFANPDSGGRKINWWMVHTLINFVIEYSSDKLSREKEPYTHKKEQITLWP